MKNITPSILLLSSLAIPLAACQPSEPKSFTAPNGAKASTLSCKSDPSGCFEKAAQVCGGQTYRVVDSYSKAGGIAADIIPGPVTWYHMTVQCGAPDGRMPNFPFRGGTFGDMMSAAAAMQPKYEPNRTMSCNSTRYGNQVQTNCW